MTKLNRWIAAAALALASSAALAAPVTLSATGQVVATDTDDGILGIPFSAPVGPGTRVNVSWTFDLDLFGADSNPDPAFGVYSGGGISARVQVGNDLFELQPSAMLLGVLPGAAGAGLTTYSFAFTGLGNLAAEPPLTWLFAVNFELADANPTEQLPALLDPASFQDLRLQYQIQQGLAPGAVRFDAFGAALTPVPLPAAGWLLLAGLGALAPLRRKRRADV